MITITIIGDDSRYNFLFELVPQFSIPKYKLSNDDIVVLPTNVKENMAFDKSIKLISSRLPLATTVFFPSEFDHITESRAILYFEGFEFFKSSTLENLQVLSEQMLPVQIILYTPSRNGLDSDISTYPQAIADAKEKYEKKGYSVIQYVPKKNVFPLFIQHQVSMNTSYYSNQRLKKITEKKHDLYSNTGLKFNYRLIWLEINQLNSNDHEFIVRYDRNEFAKGSLEDIYFARAKKLIFEKERLRFADPLLKVYKDFMEDIAFWNLDKDIEILKKTVKNKFYHSIVKDNKFVFLGTKNEYDKYIKREKGIKFLERFYKFIETDFYEEIRIYVEMRLSRLERLITGK